MRKTFAALTLFLSILACNFNPNRQPPTPTNSPPTIPPTPVVLTVVVTATSTATPLPTVTIAPTITLTSTPTRPAQVSVIYRDDFSSKSSNWVTGSNEAASSDYLNGEYGFKLKRANWQSWSIAPDGKIHSNVFLEVTVKEVSADKEASPGFGLICNYKDNSNFVYAAITKTGYYNIVQKVNGEFKILSDPNGNWSLSNEIGLNAPSYRIGLDCTPNAVTLYVDGKRIDTISRLTLAGGKAGLLVEDYDKTNVEVRFDDFTITQLK
jgi:hypothetical protein